MTDVHLADAPWPLGGGELGDLIRRHDWAATMLGPSAGWPAALRTLVDVVVHAPLPMVLLWGPDLVQIYNDAYAALCGLRHPQALGRPVHDCRPEARAADAPVYEAVLRGESRTARRRRIDVARNGAVEAGWFDLGYGPAFDGARIAGVLATATESAPADLMDRKRAVEDLRRADQRIAMALDAGAVAGTWYWDVRRDHFTADVRFARYFSLDADAMRRGVPLAQVVQSIHPDDEPTVARLIGEAMVAGGRYRAEYRVRQPAGGYRWVEANGFVDLDADGNALTFPGVIVDIEGRKGRDARQGALLRLGDRLRQVGDAVAAADVAGEIVGRTLGATRGGFGRIDAVAATVEILPEWRARPDVASVAGLHHFADYGSFLDDLRRGDTVAIDDVGTDPRTAASADALRAIGIGALLNVPLLDAGGLCAVFLAHHDGPHAWTGDEIAFVKGAADRTWAEMTRADAVQSLRALNQALEGQVAASTRDRNHMWQLSQEIMLVAGLDGGVIAVNPAWSEVLGWQEHELVGSIVFDLLHPDDVAQTHAANQAALANGGLTPNFENRIRHRDGSHRWISWNANKRADVMIAVGRDITRERERAAALLDAEEKLRHSQKMEAVGQLTGGIAHDFNNLLASIGSSLELLSMRIRAGELRDLDRFIGIGQGSVRRAAALTHRLLAFSRRQPLDARPTDVERLVADMLDLIRRSIGPAIDLDIAHAAGPWPTLVDPNQLENALLNLCINARDAMPDGGWLSIALANTVLAPAQADAFELPPGDYLQVSVTDTGTGMAPEVAAKAFDPFYTTKPIGQGTGLGLSMIYGFARQSGGHARLDTAPGRGTTMHLYLPRHHGSAAGAPGVSPAAASVAAGAVRSGADGADILLVDDEAALRGLVAEALGRHGHRVIQAPDAAAALRLIDGGAAIDLLVTDIGLAGGMNGRQLADFAREMRPGLRVLFITGYAEAKLVERGDMGDGTQLMVKPFVLEALARRVAEMTAAQASNAPA